LFGRISVKNLFSFGKEYMWDFIIENVGLSGRPRSGSERKSVYFLGWWAGLDVKL